MGVLIAVALELAGVRALPFAVGMYLPIAATVPIFLGGMVRWLADLFRGSPVSEAESETSPGVLLSSGYIAGGTLCGLVIAFLNFPIFETINNGLNLAPRLGDWTGHTDWLESPEAKIISLITFGILGAILFWQGLQKPPKQASDSRSPQLGYHELGNSEPR